MARYVKLKVSAIVSASLNAPSRSIAPDFAQELHMRSMTPLTTATTAALVLR
ncbi:hypothetical protein AURDEDRAFT_174765 [Auricularia subglabra TFB-10046 SS5]|uniref:Uncharacterized protein n=1 Tax=Auricularia subglabra (strain TFB-10046 / SS5) TaxID=717982 RepID=J0WSL1_AURST|nr:hypothetical protein AURDEDRAFT_174765 [Auricularia subglabra TFB-10046 SS5]